MDYTEYKSKKELIVKHGKKGIFRIIFSRTAILVLLLLLQAFMLLFMFKILEKYVVLVYGGTVLLSAVLVIYVVNKEENPAFKLAWIVPILVFPVFGALLYLFVQLQVDTRRIDRRLQILHRETWKYMSQENCVMDELEEEDAQGAGLARYIHEYSKMPIYQNSSAKYFPVGEEMFEEMQIQLKKAKKFIFLEYFIVEEGYMWNTILEILEQKVKEGVEVRFMYDGMCSIMLLPYNYPKKMEALGIKCKMFSPIKPALSTYQNNRDHRKILVIDGQCAFTGGINLADEYINKKVRFGHWKDTGIMIQGDSVESFTVMFLQMWNVDEKRPEEYQKYLRLFPQRKPVFHDGFIMPYGDSPFDKEQVGETVYLDMLYTAKKYVHIMTPYLIPSNEMVTALTYAAKRGVEVIILMPRKPDKWYAFALAKTYYNELIRSGVQIYEYLPGFIHAKSFVSDDKKAVVGSINLDFRSLYLHFECAAYLYKNSAIDSIEDDFQKTMEKSERMTIAMNENRNLFMKLFGYVIRIMAPLM